MFRILVFLLLLSACFQTKAETIYRNLLNQKVDTVQEKLPFLIQELSRCSNSLETAIVHNFIGVEFQGAYEFDSALVHHQKAFELLVLEMPKHEETAISLNKIGIIYIYTGSFLESVRFLKSASQLFETGILKANSLNNLAIAYKYLGEVDNAILEYQRAFQIFMDFQAYEKALDVQMNIANLHMNQNNDSIAMIYLKDAEKIALKQELKEQYYRSRCEQAVILRNKGEMKDAIEMHLECEIYFKSTSLVSLRTANLNNLAIAYGGIEETEKEIQIYHQLIEITTEHQLYNLLTAVKANLGAAYLLQELTDLAETNLLEALDLASQLNNTDYLLSIYGSLSEVYKAKNQNEKALHYAEIEINLRDSLLENERLLAMIESEARMKTQFFKDSLKQAKTELQNKNKDISTSDDNLESAILFIYFLIPIILILGVIYFRKRQRSKLLSQDVEIKEASIQSLNERVGMSEAIIESIENTTKKPYPSNLEGLTEREKQSLTLLAEGLSDMEISDSLYLSPATIRTHLRKAYAKIDVKNRAQATQFVLAHHI